MNKAICIIPARGGSKRIPLKNLKSFKGKPVIAYSISLALNSGLFEEVMVSTDHEAIAQLALALGAKVPFYRSAKNADDHAGTAAVVEEVLQQYAEQNRFFDLVCCLYPTAPLATPHSFKQGFEKIKEGDCSIVFPVVAFSFPIWRSVLLEGDRGKMAFPEHYLSRSQDLPLAHHDAGQWYFLKPELLLESKPWVGKDTKFIELSELEVQDLDNESDWALAELKYELLQNSGKII